MSLNKMPQKKSKNSEKSQSSTRQAKDKSPGNSQSNLSAPFNHSPSLKLFGNWTGKTPQTLLHEHCQKNGWEKVQFQMLKKPQGFQALVHLSKRDAKDQGSIHKLTFCHSQSYYPTDQEAKHVQL